MRHFYPLFYRLFWVLCCCAAFTCRAQCPDFTDLTASGVQCQYGTFSNPFTNTGIATGRHTVITQQGSDINTGHQLPFLPPGENSVIKLGNERTGAEAEAVTYTFTVDEDYAILLLKFAVVMEDPGHPQIDQPQFVVRVLNSNNELAEMCAEYAVSAAGDIPGFQSYGRIRWRPWTNVGVDLSDYIGQTVRVQFITYDCDWYGHYGYAYFTGRCVSSRLDLEACDGDLVTLSAPEGFESYQWDNGSTATSTQYTVSGNGTSANCLITSATGCQFTLNAYLSNQGNLPTQSSTIWDTICQGDSYTEHFFNLPPQNEPGTTTHRNSFYNPTNCTGNVTTTLFLTVLPRVYDIYEAICYGDDYHANGFHVTQPTVGVQTLTRTAPSPYGCDSVINLHLTVNPSFNLPNQIVGETNPCQSEVYTYTLPNADGLATFYWQIPTGVHIMSGQGTPEVNLYFGSEAPNPATITLLGENGCGNGAVPLTITYNPSYNLFFTDTLCTGNEYHAQGFDLPRQDSAGYFTYINRYQTAAGCDSTRVLALLVTPTPEIDILAQPEAICVGEESQLHAMGELAEFGGGGAVPAVAIGDILSCLPHFLIVNFYCINNQ